MFILKPWVLATFAMAATTGPDGAGQLIEAESLYFEGGEYVESPDASGGEYVELRPGSAMMLEIEATETVYDLVLGIMGATEGTEVSVRIGEFPPVITTLPMGTTQTPYEIAIRLPEIPIGFYPCWIEIPGSSTGGFGCDWCMYTPGTSEPTCDGCTLAPMTSPLVAPGDGKTVTLPPIPGLGLAATAATTIYAAAWGSVSVQTADVVHVTTSDKEDGSCEFQAPATGGGPDVCKEKTPCSVTSTLKFKANDYLRWKFWDTTEKVTMPDGSSDEFARQGVPFTRSKTITIACDSAKKITWTFEYGGVVTHDASCNKCE